MSLNSASNEGPTEPYNIGVYMLTGVNGIGKSTIVDAIAKSNPEVVPVHASHELSKLFNGITRDEMELLDPAEKLGRMVTHFTTIFERVLNSDMVAIIDTHLLVPIRSKSGVRYEDIWSDLYSPYVSSMAMLTASPDTVRKWRLGDEVETGRKRNTVVDDILQDQNVNVARFSKLKTSGSIAPHSGCVENVDAQIARTRADVDKIFRNR